MFGRVESCPRLCGRALRPIFTDFRVPGGLGGLGGLGAGEALTSLAFSSVSHEPG